MTRRTARTVFADSRADADQARRDMLVRLNLRESLPLALEIRHPILYASEVFVGLEQVMNTPRDTVARFSDAMVGWLAELDIPVVHDPPETPAPTLAEIMEHSIPMGRFDIASEWQDRLYAAYADVNARRLVVGPVPEPAPNGDAYRRHHGPVWALHDYVCWPDEGYPCQLCWARARWPWEPARACPADVDVASTYCKAHRGTDMVLGPFGAGNSFVFTHAARM